MQKEPWIAYLFRETRSGPVPYVERVEVTFPSKNEMYRVAWFLVVSVRVGFDDQQCNLHDKLGNTLGYSCLVQGSGVFVRFAQAYDRTTLELAELVVYGKYLTTEGVVMEDLDESLQMAMAQHQYEEMERGKYTLTYSTAEEEPYYNGDYNLDEKTLIGDTVILVQESAMYTPTLYHNPFFNTHITVLFAKEDDAPLYSLLEININSSLITAGSEDFNLQQCGWFGFPWGRGTCDGQQAPGKVNEWAIRITKDGLTIACDSVVLSRIVFEEACPYNPQNMWPYELSPDQVHGANSVSISGGGLVDVDMYSLGHDYQHQPNTTPLQECRRLDKKMVKRCDTMSLVDTDMLPVPNSQAIWDSIIQEFDTSLYRTIAMDKLKMEKLERLRFELDLLPRLEVAYQEYVTSAEGVRYIAAKKEALLAERRSSDRLHDYMDINILFEKAESIYLDMFKLAFKKIDTAVSALPIDERFSSAVAFQIMTILGEILPMNMFVSTDKPVTENTLRPLNFLNNGGSNPPTADVPRLSVDPVIVPAGELAGMKLIFGFINHDFDAIK